MSRRLKIAIKYHSNNQSEKGFVLPLAVGMGMVMILVGTTMVMRSQQDQITASVRREAGQSLYVTEAGIARTLSQLNQPNNRPLLGGNYDPANPTNSNKQYLGSDGRPRSGDETTPVIPTWTTGAAGAGGTSTCSSSGGSGGTPNITTNPVSSGNGTYTIRAYRYVSGVNEGSLLVEGRQEAATSWIWVRIPVQQTTDNFPGVLARGKMELLGRGVVGTNGNVYYDPASSTNTRLTGSAAPGAANRGQYLNAIKSGSSDGITGDRISGRIIACRMNPPAPPTLPALTPNSGDIAKANRTFFSTNVPLVTPRNTVTYIRIGKIDLDNNNTVNVDTTNGPVYLYVQGPINMTGNSRIRNVNIINGVMQSSPRVGDLRIFITTTDAIQIYGSSCIHAAFVYARNSNIQMGGSGDGCGTAPGQQINIHGVVWSNSITNTSGTFAGVSVPEDISSLADLTNSLGLAVNYRVNGPVISWQQQGG